MRPPVLVAVSMLALLLMGLGGVPYVHSADVLSSFGTAKVDGVISPDEYGSCIGPITQGPYTFTICETNDNTNDYYALQISGDTTPPSCNDPTNPVCNDFFEMWFDNTNDDTLISCSSGGAEDVLFLKGPSGIFMDLWECYGPLGNEDTTRGGSNHGAGAVNEASTPFVFEMSHPLSSGDANDYSLNVGSTVGWCMAYLDNDVEIVRYPSGCMGGWESTGSQSLFGDVVKVGPPTACNGLSTDKSYYYLGETVNVALCYTLPKECTADSVKHDVIVLHDGSEVEQLDTFGGSSTEGCTPSSPMDYKYVPTDEGVYTVQFVREAAVGGSSILISETQFEVGYGNANGSPVGGAITPADKLVILAPYLVLIGLVGAGALLTARKKRRS